MAERPVETRTLTAALEIREDGDAPVLEGYAATFNQPYDLGPFREQIHPAAFNRTLGTNPDVRLLIDHEGQPLARTKSGTLEMRADAQGLHIRAQLDQSDPDVQRLLPKLRRGDLDQMSFAFRVPQGGDEWTDNYSMRTLRNVELNGGDVSVVTYPANPNTTVTVRAEDTEAARWTLAETLLRDVRDGKAPLDDLLAALTGETRTAAVEDTTELDTAPDAPEAEDGVEDEPEGMSLELAEALIKSVEK